MSVLERIKRFNLVEILSRCYGLVFSRCGAQWRSLSPFTVEKRPSFFVGCVNERWLFHDFSYGKGGSLIDFVMLKENLSNVSEALVYIRRSILGGVEPVSGTRVSVSAAFPGVKAKKRPAGGEVLRGLYRKLKRNDIGLCCCYLQERGLPPGLIEELRGRNLLLHNRYNGKSWCCFAVFSPDGELCCLDNHEIGGRGKFVIGSKSIFTFDMELCKADKLFVCEGIIDYLSLKVLLGAGYPGIALLGNRVGFDAGIFNSVDDILSGLDHDDAGRRGLRQLYLKFKNKKFWECNFNGCKDANDYLLRYPCEKIKMTRIFPGGIEQNAFHY